MKSFKLRDNGALVVALDLPGYGGSDSLSQYGPDEVLNAIVEAIVLLKKQTFPNSAGGCILIGHDWGGAITARLAAETEGLFDRAIYLNAPYVSLAACDFPHDFVCSDYSVRADAFGQAQFENVHEQEHRAS